jgi:hypothetical protein
MSIVIVLIVVLLVAGLVANFYPKPKKTTFLAPGETLTPEVETEERLHTTVVSHQIPPYVPTPRAIEEPLDVPTLPVVEPKEEVVVPTLAAKPKQVAKKPQPKKQQPKKKVVKKNA